MKPIEAVLEALDGCTAARTLWPDDARAYAAAIRESLPQIYTAETIGEAPEGDYRMGIGRVWSKATNSKFATAFLLRERPDAWEKAFGPIPQPEANND